MKTIQHNNELLGSIQFNPLGVNLEITKGGGAYDHASMRSSQLAALTSYISISSGNSGDGLSLISESIQNNLLWLVSSLAQEVADLLPMFAEEAQSRGAHREKQSANEAKQNLNAVKIRNLKEASHAR